MGKKVDRWIADDGTEFQDQKTMLLYEMTQVDAKEIEVFLREKFPDKSKRISEYKRLLIDWQAYMRENSSQTVMLPKPEPVYFDQEVQEWVPADGYFLDEYLLGDTSEIDEQKEIDASFKRATKI